MLKELLLDLSRASQGNVEASEIPDEDVIAGRATQIQEATRKVFKQFKRGPLIRMLIEGERGYIIICDAGDDAILVVLTNKRANIGYMFFSMSRTARRIDQVLS
jgi:predicted regulator of Ras-like GTPase activity (Roadblock/LC7/MglB family)